MKSGGTLQPAMPSILGTIPISIPAQAAHHAPQSAPQRPQGQRVDRRLSEGHLRPGWRRGPPRRLDRAGGSPAGGARIDPMSSLGMASVTSQMKKSWIGWRSGRSGVRFIVLLPTINALSCFHTPMSSIRVITHRRFSCFTHHWLRVFTHQPRFSCFYTPFFVYLPTGFRAFTHRAFLIRVDVSEG